MIVTICFLFAAVQLTSSLNVDIPVTVYELARGDNAVLPCNFKPQKPDNPSVTISWVAHPDNPDDPDIEILSYYYFATSSPTLDIMDDFTDRASLQVDIPKGSAILTLKGLTSKDSRMFQCEVKIPGDRQGKTSDTTKVVVLVAPSKPICGIQGKAEYYQNINLTCRSEEGTPAPTYKWQSFDVSNTPRPFPLRATEANGVLSLYNISAETSGYYICTSANKIRSESCNLTLSVMPFSMNIGSTAGIIGACVVGLLILIVVVCCCHRHCRKKKAAAMGYPEHSEYTDKEPQEIEMHQDKRLESKADKQDDRVERVDRPSDYDDKRSDRYDDRRSDYDDHRSDRYDRRSEYDDRRNDRYDDRRNNRYNEPQDRSDDRQDRYDRYDERRERYDHPEDRYDDRRNRYDHPDDRYDNPDDRKDRYDHPDDRSRPPNVPANKPTRN